MEPDCAESFWRACGAKGPLRVTVSTDGEVAPRAGKLPYPVALVGRDEANDVVLDDDRVGHRHAYVQILAGRPYCVDLGSLTGVAWGGTPKKAGWLDPAQGLVIAGFQMRFEGMVAAEPPDWDPLET